MHAFATPAGGHGPTRLPPMLSFSALVAQHDRHCRQPIVFRHFMVLPAERALQCKGAPVDIGGRAFDLLLVLLRARGAVVGKDEIMRQVWPSTFVDEGNLRFQMAMLRKALGDDRDLIKTVTGRGYLLIDERDEAAPSA